MKTILLSLLFLIAFGAKAQKCDTSETKKVTISFTLFNCKDDLTTINSVPLEYFDFDKEYSPGDTIRFTLYNKPSKFFKKPVFKGASILIEQSDGLWVDISLPAGDGAREYIYCVR